MTAVKQQYDADFLAWSRQQADALRAAARTGSNQALDWQNLAEEIESLGAAERRSLASQLQRIVRHLLKLEYSQATEPRRGWIESINDARGEIDLLCETSPSLGGELGAAITGALRRGARQAINDLGNHGEIDPGLLARIRARVTHRSKSRAIGFQRSRRSSTGREPEPSAGFGTKYRRYDAGRDRPCDSRSAGRCGNRYGGSGGITDAVLLAPEVLGDWFPAEPKDSADLP
ncbi:MAG TPA: DUF29 domain-containing protein [Stellaceae bacterium]|jgi:hypothetical protein|nr:DUF29 domain-containing protein [Stellaceae bacterium]